MIRIIKGVYGYVTPNGIVKPKTGKDGPFELTVEQEARLVRLGVAAYVVPEVPAEDEDEAENEPENKEHENEPVEPVETGNLDPEQLKELTNAELKELAEEMGIDTGKLRTKALLIEAITAAEVIPGSVEDGGETPSEFDPAEAVK